MKQKPETLFVQHSLASIYLLYGNNDRIIDYLATSLLPTRFKASNSEVDFLAERDLLDISKSTLFINQSLFNPKKIVVIREVTDTLLPLIEAYKNDLPLVLLGKNLRANSKLVQFIQGHKNYSAVAIYGDEPSFLKSYFQYVFHDRNLEQSALALLLDEVSSFFEAQRMQQLLTQLCPVESVITNLQVQQLLTQYTSPEMFRVVAALLRKSPRALIEGLQVNKVYLEKELIPFIRLTGKQLWELVDLSIEVLKGVTAIEAVKKATPKIPFQRHDEIITNLSKWSVSGLLSATLMLDKLEASYKQNHALSWSEVERTLLKTCKL